MMVSMLVGMIKSSYDNVHDMILAGELCRKDSGLFLEIIMALSVDERS